MNAKPSRASILAATNYLTRKLAGRKGFGAIEEVRFSPDRFDIELWREIRDELAAVMQEKVGVYRSGPVLEEAKRTVTALKDKFQSVTVDDKGKTFNTDLIHTIETGYLLDLADCMVTGAIARHESRGAHSRTDFTERDDENWMKHTLAYLDDGEIRLDYSPVTMTKYEPQVRTY